MTYKQLERRQWMTKNNKIYHLSFWIIKFIFIDLRDANRSKRCKFVMYNYLNS